MFSEIERVLLQIESGKVQSRLWCHYSTLKTMLLDLLTPKSYEERLLTIKKLRELVKPYPKSGIIVESMIKSQSWENETGNF